MGWRNLTPISTQRLSAVVFLTQRKPIIAIHTKYCDKRYFDPPDMKSKGKLTDHYFLKLNKEENKTPTVTHFSNTSREELVTYFAIR